ncbi:pappalysin-2 isoform X2 [Engraulis encrasicolus]|uniref:pappalysin-2 isoform X2 n=1 Tax=Engraulis encrasicolus TaxID=184585 RepID=UPI002FD08043
MEMMLFRLLVIVIFVVNSLLLKSAHSDLIKKYKQILAQRADREQAVASSEQCGSVSRRRLARAPTQYHPPSALAARRTRLKDIYHETTLAGQSGACTGACSPGNRLRVRELQGVWESREREVKKIQEESFQPGKLDSLTDAQSVSPHTLHTRSLNSMNSPHTAQLSERYQQHHPDTFVLRGSQQHATDTDSLSSPQRQRRNPVSSHAGDFGDFNAKQRFTRSAHNDQSSDYSVESEDYSGEQEGVPSPSSDMWGRSIREIPPEWMSVLYFGGRREQLRINPAAGIELPRKKFSIELWVKPEGGQNNPAIIAGVFDNCSHPLNEKGWSVGIRTSKPAGRKDGRYFFTLRTDRNPRATTVTDHQHYRPNVWTHLLATYDGSRMVLYVNGAKVGESSHQTGALYSPFMRTCRVFLLGGDQTDSRHSFRGLLGGVRLWGHSRAQGTLLGGHREKDPHQSPLLATWADFSYAEQWWVPYKDRHYPSVLALPIPEPELASPFLPPLCGLTVCDNKDIILSYNEHWQLRTEKHIHYRVVNVCNNDGSHPTVSAAQIQRQHQALAEAFRPYNLSLELSVHTVYNSTLRQRFILGNCPNAKIGNKHCDPECDHPLTGHDGGDCLHKRPCYPWRRQDGECNTECNTVDNEYDDGDCCDPDVTDVGKTCFDPESPYRAYLSVRELRDLLHLNSSNTLNVFFANNSAREELAGSATWPWAKEALSHQGGMILNPSYYGTAGHNNTMIHELGHVLGLYHVFKGVSERESCDDPCQETEASMETGDLCADTEPTPKSKACRDPDPVNDACGSTHYNNTPYNNYMSYTDDNCTNHFTPNQVARMHCYVDLVYQSWVQERKPAPIPLAPMVVGQTGDSVSVHWLSPISGPLYQREGDVNCQRCDEDGVLHQYAHEATSPHGCDTSGYWTPEEAVGAPDVYQPCEPSMQAWSPEVSLYDANITSPCPQGEGCVLELYFLQPVLADSLTVWVTYISASNPAISNIELIMDTGESLHMGPHSVYCDIPLTLRVNTDKRVAAVKVCTFDRKMEIDAVLLTSRPRNALCSGCQPLRYQLHRRPPFSQEDSPVHLTQLTYTDRDVVRGVNYQYWVQAEAGGLLSEPSPPLLYTHPQPFCGDGLLQGTERCDDGNLLDGDGCSKKCTMEPSFNCEGQPSLCYVFEGDGICEEFEKGSSFQDCGYFTPVGYTDQWASTALASHQDHQCPAAGATGEPALSQMCKTHNLDVENAVPQGAWIPCTAQTQISSYNEPDPPVWLKVGFDMPGVAASVIVYLTSDGGWHGDRCRSSVAIQLCDTNGKNHSLGDFELSCQRNPLVVNVTHNLSLPFYLTSAVMLSFSSAHVGVTGVALRTSCLFSAFALTGCVHRPCGTDSCKPLQIEHAFVTCTVVADMTRCTVLCHRGYTLSVLSGKGLPSHQRDISLSCSHGVWERVVTCQPVDCGLPDQSHVFFATFKCPRGTTFGKQCTFSCRAPAILQGDSDTVVCLEDGLWSYPEAYCKTECPDPPAVPSAKLLVPECDGTRHDVGTVCRYKCNPGYYVADSLNKKIRKFLKLECLEGGTWEMGACVPVSCPAPRALFEGMYACTNGLDFDTVCTLHCPGSTEKHSIRCTKDGRWTEEFRMCKNIDGDCLPPPDINLVEYMCDEGFGIGAVCYPTCIVALSDPVVLTNGTTADTVKHWMRPSKVESIVCTGLRKWYPDPKIIHCIQSCEPFGGDGWCDTINNRAYCQYDGGDCCPSTLSTGKVIQFGVDCDHDECTCRDPEAEENKNKGKLTDPAQL